MRTLPRVWHCFLGVLLAASCSGGNPDLPECEDNADNDGDTLIDFEDPACQRGSDVESDDPITDCNNDQDDDDDGLTDLEDPGCQDIGDDSELDNPTPRCGDGEDNDDDGLTDYPDDPGCFNPLQDSEDDDCPDGPNCPECANGDDDDDDTKADYPLDTGCTAASDASEATADPTACAGVTFEPGAEGVFTGMLQANGQRVLTSTTCGGDGVEVVYELQITEPIVMVASTALTGTVADTTLYVRSRCMDATTELACNDNANPNTLGSKITVALDPGFYYLVVDGTNLSNVGAYTLEVEFFPGEGTPCSGDDCAPGLVCRMLEGATETTCELPVCSDGRDDDDDLTTDYPADPGCDTPDDPTEDDDCPDGPNCPECSNDDDDDGDNMTDWPDDTTCAAASSVSESCDDADPVLNVTMPIHTGNTSGLTNDFPSTCFGGEGPDQVWTLNLPVPVTSLTVDLSGTTYDSVHMLKDGSCGATSLECEDGFLITHGPLAAGGYTIIIDGWASSSAGAYAMAVHGTVTGGEACTSPLFTTGVLSCETGFACDGSVCAPAACNDSDDDDGDGDGNGYPTDPGCSSISDGDEEDDCPSGPNCPACANDLDDDGDGQFDFPMDTNCTSASADSEACGDTDPIGQVTLPQHTGDTTGSTNDFEASCASAGSEDEVWTISLPVSVSSFHADTVGTNFDTVLYMKDATCAGADLACNDQGGVGNSSAFTTGPLPAGNYALVVDGWITGNFGPYTLNVSAVANPGQPCNSPLFATGVLTCGGGSVCNGTVCVGAACSDGMDNDGDGDTDYPNDPGCQSTLDTDEADNCPTGPGCPACADGVDNDGDGAMDYPADTDCTSASRGFEVCGEETDALFPLTTPTLGGDNIDATDNVDPVCGSVGGRDIGYLLAVPVQLTSLTVDTIGSSFDTLVHIDTAACGGAFLGCDDDAGGSGASLLTVNNVPPGNYVVFVDGYSEFSFGGYVLHAHGVAASGASCTSPLFASGVLSCASGQTCNGTVCAAP